MRKLFENNVLLRGNTGIIIGFIAALMVIFSLNPVTVSRIFGYGLTAPSAPICGDTRPASAPDLFQVNSDGNTAKLFFTPISNTNKYYISFSTKASAEEHGVEVTLGNLGVQNFTINQLKFNTIYYFKVRGQIGCMPGDWSNIMKVTTRTRFYTQVVSFFKNSVFRPISTFIANVVRPVEQNQVVAPSPVVTPGTKTFTVQPTIAPQAKPVGVPVIPTPAPKVGFWQSILNFFSGK
jgi:hypothetical protein